MSDNSRLPFRGATRLPNDVWEHALLRPEVDEVFNALCDRRRRLVLLLLKEDAIETTADVIFKGEGNAATLELELVHNHLPQLSEAGYVEWDQYTGEISRGPRFDEVELLLDLLDTHAEELPNEWL